MKKSPPATNSKVRLCSQISRNTFVFHSNCVAIYFVIKNEGHISVSLKFVIKLLLDELFSDKIVDLILNDGTSILNVINDDPSKAEVAVLSVSTNSCANFFVACSLERLSKTCKVILYVLISGLVCEDVYISGKLVTFSEVNTINGSVDVDDSTSCINLGDPFTFLTSIYLLLFASQP